MSQEPPSEDARQKRDGEQKEAQQQQVGPIRCRQRSGLRLHDGRCDQLVLRVWTSHHSVQRMPRRAARRDFGRVRVRGLLLREEVGRTDAAR